MMRCYIVLRTHRSSARTNLRYSRATISTQNRDERQLTNFCLRILESKNLEKFKTTWIPIKYFLNPKKLKSPSRHPGNLNNTNELTRTQTKSKNPPTKCLFPHAQLLCKYPGIPRLIVWVHLPSIEVLRSQKLVQRLCLPREPRDR